MLINTYYYVKMNIQEKILKVLIENNQKTLSINEISKLIESDYKLVHTNIKKLLENDLIRITKLGNSNQIQFKYNLNHQVFNVETIRKNNILKNRNLKIIVNRLNEIKSQFFTALLFGSYAKGIQTKESDIDICIIADNENIIKEIYSELNLLPLDIHLTEFTSKEFKSMLKTTDFNVGQEIKKNYIILNNIELFYKLLK